MQKLNSLGSFPKLLKFVQVTNGKLFIFKIKISIINKLCLWVVAKFYIVFV